ncbi:MAG: hypothetical protein ACD_73C00063G0003 [uncultured bacterium]|nr:MAG: hypothetical protein ACD_73C00063G0003 [uncultured bacterium]
MPPFLETIKNFKTKLAGFRAKFSSPNKNDKALQDLQNLAASRPGDMRIQIKIADIYYQNKNLEMALETLQGIAQKYIQQNFALKAVAVYKKMLMMNPSVAQTNMDLAGLFEKMNMPSDAVIQYRIALQQYYSSGTRDKVIEITKKIASLDGSLLNKRHLAEIYQSFGMLTEALQEFETVAQLYRQQKQFDELLKLYEIILPHKPTNHALIKDVCILYLRKQQPDHAIKTMERYKVDADPAFNDLYEKAKLMKKALRSAKS